MRIAERPDDFGPADLEHHLILLTGECETNPALRYWTAEGDLSIEFAGVMEAKATVEHFNRENAEKWAREANEENGEVDRYDGDEQTGREEATVAGAKERPLIEF
ncbi:uncharacterized protein BDZ99DRAFT_514190 [Mytilinidion resinicola]|uniref:Uncharacterized protein n=1 Tax=Mytilinidion resinicola TaxID=574789 RepID=A0A6A6ZB96_9PEZI|nr:uncharacterized protein BDZ99DRAFT_514190 [Mytilinidion resinicola]KAF2817969.1 hypothetical protein BDZ99DRAFT_514190 [Mytilinidion resinicola]